MTQLESELDILQQQVDRLIGTTSVCPACGEVARIRGTITNDGRVILTCFDAVDLDSFLR